MPRLTKLALALCLTVLVAGCQLALPGGGGRTADTAADGVTANAVTGDAIEVTALDPPVPDPVAGSAADPALAPAGPDTAAPSQADPAPATDAGAAPEGTAPPAPQPDLAAEVPPTPKSTQQLACEKKRGTWARTGTGALRTCVFPTRDAGKQCTRESQCDGVCLARSGTCSPVKPLLGCNEILQDNGARVTLCIE